MCVGMLARLLIVGELHADFVAYALAPEIPVEVIVGHAAPKYKKMTARSGQGARAVDVSSLGMPRFSVRHASGLARPRHSFVIARRDGGTCSGQFAATTLGQLRGRAVEVCCATAFWRRRKTAILWRACARPDRWRLS